ncbi:hypothetical protein CVT91_04890 [Candidatus Atribacteria bacterium HGW-Atribacteria-1]|nr:MAG: hypothetical protein CVT91_04890 [Candidatus Atribacteria bacterium HGW-Atribacteria-1]
MNNVREKDKLNFLNFFKGREDYFALQGDDDYQPINQPLSEQYLEKHFNGFVTFGIYVLTKSSQCNFICIDIDISKSKLDDIKFKDQKKKYIHLKDKLIIFQKNITEKLNIEKDSILFEDTGGRGYHIWVFFEEAITGKDARKLYHILKTDTDLDFEFFPKQSNLTEKRNYGNLIKLPLGIHQKYNRRSTFFTISDSSKLTILPWEKNFVHLQSIKKVKKSNVEQIIKNNEALLEREAILEIKNEKIPQGGRIYYKDDPNFLFENCRALNQLKNKAENNIQLTHAEMFHFANVILSIPNTEKFLIDIIKKSYGINFNHPYTKREIDLIKEFHPTSCNKLIQEGICDGYCNETIKEKNIDPLLSNTTPLSFWLTPIKRKSSIKNEELVDSISDVKNIKNAYWKLKKYHEYEDALFFDEFDFEQFENDLDIYAQYISLYFQQKEEIPFLGYLKVNFPKKVDENEEMQYRQMAYSTIFDQVIIQSIFNVISIIFEENFQNSSHGYRFNTDILNTNDIFRDWREYYPQFRNNVLDTNRKSEIKYRVSCDISKFYDNIKHDILIQQIQKYITDDYIFATVKRIVELYKYDKKTKKGLPQGPAYARILANLYLNKFDEEISQYVTGYYRYVDDVFLFFKDEKDAENGLKKAVTLLNELELALSQDAKKSPKIVKASEEGDLVNYLDSIMYGIFEEFKFIDILNTEEEIQNFYEIVEKKAIPRDPQEIIEINDDIPTIIYLISKNFPFSIQLKKKIPAIVNYLVEKNIFFPKRLKSKKHKFIFYDLIHLFPEININLVPFYQNLDDCHKIYFFLCLYYIYKSQEKFKEELKKITIINLKSKNPFLKGYAVTIAKKIKLEEFFLNEECIKDILSLESYFPKLKLFSCINYFELTEDLRSLIQDYLKQSSNYIIRKYFLSNLSYENAGLIDNLFLANLIISNVYLLLPECCILFINFKDKNDLFFEFERVIVGKTKYKKLSIEYLKSILFDLHENSSKLVLSNRITLYTKINDTELKRELIKVINKIDKELNISEEDNVRSSGYNECFLREYLDEDSVISKYEEIIPYNKLKKYQLDDLDRLKSCLQDLSSKKILPSINFEFDSTKEEITIHYSKPKDFVDFNYDLFPDNEQSILKLFLVIDDLFKKTQYFYRVLNTIPLIKDDQLFIDPLKNEVIFKTFGRILCPKYVIDSSVINNSGFNNIPKLISNLMRKTVFTNEEQYSEFRKSSKIGIKLFLAQFIHCLAYDNPYSYSRFHYLIGQIRNINTEPNYKFKLSLLYYYERFKSNLFIKNQENIEWLSICKSLELLYKEVGISFDFIDFNNVDYKNKTFMNRKYTSNFHYLSIQLLNILLNVEDIFKFGNIDCVYANLVNLLNYYAIFCIEIICLLKSGIKSSDKTIKELPTNRKLRVKVDEYSYELNDEDIEIINLLIRLRDEKQDLFNYLVNYNLKQITTLFLFILFDTSIKDDNIVIRNNDVLKDKYFESLYTTFFIRLPNIELKVNKHMQELLNDLRTNQNTVSIDNSILEDDVLMSCRDIHGVLKSLHIKRFKGKNIHAIKFWPIEIHLKSFFKKTVVTNNKVLEKIPLVSGCPSSTVKCTWDISNGQVINAVIPNNGVNKLISKLEEGKIFGYKWKYLYSEKAKIIYDSLFFFILVTLAAYSLRITHSLGDKQDSSILLYYLTLFTDFVLIGGAGFFFIKAIKDIKYWSKELYSIIKYFKE